jgi:hypothetical protein
MTPEERSPQRLIALVIAAALALNYPLLFLFSGHGLIFGIPVLYCYLFLIWAAFIVLTALLMKDPDGRRQRVKTQATPEERSDA